MVARFVGLRTIAAGRLNTYNYTPRVSVSHDGAQLVFASNFGLPIDAYTSYVDTYTMTVPNPPPAVTANATISTRTQTSVSTGTQVGGQQGVRPPYIAPTLLGPRDRPFIYDYLYPPESEEGWN